MKTAISIIEKYLNENFWIDHSHQNGYPTKVMAKVDFMSMLNELKLEYTNQSREEGSGKLPTSCIDEFTNDRFCDRIGECEWCKNKK